MGPVSDGIDGVRAVALPAAVWADGGDVESPGAALVSWRSSLSGKFYQVYMNGRFAGATVDCQQRQMVVPEPMSGQTSLRVAVFAVEPGEAHVDFGSQVEQAPVDTGRVSLSLLRSQTLPVKSVAHVYWDHGGGEVDYSEPVSAEPVWVWASGLDKAGFGMSRFGRGDFGYESAGAVGLGQGSFGHGPFGMDADVLTWVSGPMDLGRCRFAVKVEDERGNLSEATVVGPVVVTPAARGAASLEIASFDEVTGELVLQIGEQ